MSSRRSEISEDLIASIAYIKEFSTITRNIVEKVTMKCMSALYIPEVYILSFL